MKRLSPSHLLRLVTMALTIVFVVGCSGTDGDDTDTTEAVDTQVPGDALGDETTSPEADTVDEVAVPLDTSGADALAETGAGDDTVDNATCTVKGSVVNPDGAAVAEVILVLCQGDDCVFATTDAGGAFQYDGIEARETALKIVGYNQSMTSVTIPVGSCPSPEVDLGAVVIYPLGAGEVVVAADGGAAQAHTDVAITLPGGILYPNYETEREVIATELSLDDLHPALATEPAASRVFALEPYGTELTGPCDLVVTLAGHEGASVSVYSLGHDTGVWHEPVTGAVSDQGVLDLTGQGPDMLTVIKLVID